MKILIIADARFSVPPKGYAGTERKVGWLCEQLVRKGHQVTLLAGPGSKNYGKLLIHRACNNQSFFSRAFTKIFFQLQSLWASRGVDGIINFGRIDYLWALLKSSKPIVTCFDNPILQDQVDFFRRQRNKNVYLVSISKNQRAHILNGNWRLIHNGVDVDFYKPKSTQGTYLAFLGRLTPNKGVDVAIRISQKTGVPLKIAGIIPDESGAQEYFENEIKPHLSRNIEYLGEISEIRKRDLLAEAVALLFPIRWAEPFGQVLTESLSSGTPVIASPLGAVPEIIVDGKNGFLCHSEEEFIAAVSRIGKINRDVCRSDCISRFSASRMSDEYLRAVNDLIRDRNL